MIHVNWHEARAWCRWAGRRLPSEAEWEAAAGGLRASKRPNPWGDAEPSPSHANLDGRIRGCVPSASLAAGATPEGVLDLYGNVWEWTESTFLPYPGFVPDPYKDYSQPWFGSRRVLRGGSWATRARLLRPTWRNYFTPDRRDILAGFRTSALTA